MKKFQSAFLSLVLAISLSACMSYANDPEGVLYQAFQDLKNDRFEEFRDHFTGSCYTYASDEKNFDQLKQVLSKYETASGSLQMGKKDCVQVLGAKLPGHEEILGNVYRQEQCEIELVNGVNQRKVLSITMSCFHWVENAQSASAHLCEISKLSRWITSEKGTLKQRKLCEAK